MAAARDEISDAAFRLFGIQGYATTSVDDIASEAGVSRSTFFRSFGSKEAVIFPDHDELLARIEERLRSSPSDAGLAAVTDAVKIVLFHYVAEGERARERYGLTSTVPALRERELVSGARYQRLFRRYLSHWADASPEAELRAEMTAAAVVAAHNRVLRRWLRRECTDPQREIEQALAAVHRTFADESDASIGMLIVPAGVPASAVEKAVKRALEGIAVRNLDQ